MSAVRKPPKSRSRSRVVRRRSGPAVAEVHLPSDAELQQLAERIFQFSDADETEVHVDFVADALTRFANNTIHQNVAEQVRSVSVRTVYDGRTARATTNKTDDESLRRAVAASAALARSQPKNPDLLPMPGPHSYRKVNRYFAETAGATPEDRAVSVARVTELAEQNKQTAAGVFATGASASAIANSKGLFAGYRQSRAEFSITILEQDSSGWAKASAPDREEIDPEALARRASEKAAASRHRFSFLRFRRHCRTGSALLLQQPARQTSDGGKRDHSRRRDTPIAIRPAIRWRRDAPRNGVAD
jgi:hypothetical protein